MFGGSPTIGNDASVDSPDGRRETILLERKGINPNTINPAAVVIPQSGRSISNNQ